LANCGSLASWFSERSKDPSENLQKVALFPLIPKYGGDGAHVQLKCKEGEVTFARLFRNNGKYEMVIFSGDFIDVPLERLKETCWQWPHAYAKINITPTDLIDAYFSNHCHVVYGNYINELLKVCDLLDIAVKHLK
jgi:L-fucose isomerase